MAFRSAQSGYVYGFPRDHAAHIDFKTEWWHYVGHLKTLSELTYGFQVTFFRHGLSPQQQSLLKDLDTDTLYFAHFAITDEHHRVFRYYEKFIPGGNNHRVGAAVDRYHTWMDDWVIQGIGIHHQIRAMSAEHSIDLRFLATKHPVIHGVDGVSRRAEADGHASHYFSISRAEIEGVLKTNDCSSEVRGIGWMDREFGTSPLHPHQLGWDWFSIQFDNNEELMIYMLRNQDGNFNDNSSGTYIFSDGRSEHLTAKDIILRVQSKWKSIRSGAEYPAYWLVDIPRLDLSIEVLPSIHNQELITDQSTCVTYWEGSVKVSGTLHKRDVKGLGYAELTGYANRPGLTEFWSIYSRAQLR
jgi:predicted secreted hydrolase